MDTIGINEIIFVLEGRCEIVCDTYPPVTISEKESLFLPSGSKFQATSRKDSNIIILRLDPLQKLYGSFSLEELYQEAQQYSFPEEAGKLEINTMMNQYLSNLSAYIESGIKFPVLYEIKIKELLLLLTDYYEKKNLCYFFKPVLNNDFGFASFILNNWKNAKNAKELAELASYSEPAFIKKFKKVFETTPYKWLNERKSTKILYEITNTDKPLKQIAEEYDFNSQQQFNDYCIRNFKQTPGNIRNNG
ncbi:MAG: helix-turn-helix domain-containing protein [Bacteroides sp.]|nr:helix-turn-helix domain-containing protein [Bacteroides sp.]